MMARFAYVFLFTGVFCLLEMILRNFGLYFPFCALFVFYAATAFGTGWGLTAACLGGIALDFLSSGAMHPWSVLIFALVGIGHILDAYVIGTGSVLRTAIIFFYISNEGLSLVENSVHLGLPVPDKLKEVLEQLHDRESTDMKEDK